MTVVPYKESEAAKKEQVATMFNNISKRYDFLNRFLSFGIDIYWRKKMISWLKPFQPKLLLDIATGTGDVAIEAYKQLKPNFITGIDISEGMISFGHPKLKELGLEDKIKLELGDAENIHFGENHFDAITVAFGVRNFENLEAGLKEMYRVLKPGGAVVILEFSHPKMFPFKQLYWLYAKTLLPLAGRVISKDASAYSYLPDSVKAFPDGKNFVNILEKCKFTNSKFKELTFGIVTLYLAQK